MEDIRLIEWIEQPTVGIRQVVPWEALPGVVGGALSAVSAVLQKVGTAPAGAPYARYRAPMTATIDVEVGFPVVSPPPVDDSGIGLPPGGRLVVDRLPTVRVAETIHVGAYDGLQETYQRMEAWIADHRLAQLDQSWEIYESGPESDPDPATWRTRVVFPVTGPAVDEA